MRQTGLLDSLIETTRNHPRWSVLREAVNDQRAIHLAVMVEPFLSYILEGRKSIESRFSKNAIAPFCQIGKDDLVLLKLTGGPVVGCFTTASVEFVKLNEQEFVRLRQNYSSAICADGDFWRARTDKSYATLIGVRDVQELPGARVAKSDRRGWIVLHAPDPAPAAKQSVLM